MGSHKQKKSSQTNVKKRKQSAGESYESSDSGSETQQPTSPTLLNVPRFSVVKSQEEKRTMADLSPFVIEKCIQSIVGHPKTIKKLKSGDLLLEDDRQQQVENLLKTTKIFDLKVKISLHQSLNSSKGVIRCPELRPCSNKEIIDNLTDQGVTGVRNVSVRKNGVLKSTNTYVLTFNTPILPKKIKVAFLSVNVEVYIPNPLPRAGPGVERIGRTPPPLAQSVETWPIGVRLVCRELRPVSLEERILVIELVGCGRHATHYFGLNFS